jgi:hypothetical protein
MTGVPQGLVDLTPLGPLLLVLKLQPIRNGFANPINSSMTPGPDFGQLPALASA